MITPFPASPIQIQDTAATLRRFLRHLSFLVPVLCFCAPLLADVGRIAPRPLVDISAAGSETKFESDAQSTAQVTISRSDDPAGVVVTCAPGDAGYPGVHLKTDESTPLDLSPYGDIQVRVTNTGTQDISLGMRVDDTAGISNASVLYLHPGQTDTCKVIFGVSFGNPAQSVKSSSITHVLLFVGKATTAPEIFRIESVIAGGVAGEKMPIVPGNVRTKPTGGLLLGAGAAALDSSKNLVNNNGAQGSLVDASGAQALKIVFPGGSNNASAGIKPEMGLWLLTDSIEVRAKVRNDGNAPVTPKLHMDSTGGPVEVTADAPLAPGAETELVASYINPKIWKNTPPETKNDPGTGNIFTSNTVADVLVSVGDDSAERTLTVESIVADAPPDASPVWLGKRPPVDGDWTQTFDEEFNGKSIDKTKWNISEAPNYWDQISHFTKDDAIIGDGVMKIHYEKKTGFQNDDPTQKKTDYAVGYIDTYGRWVQRYGYWEARLKVPRAPGLWPGFWLMPDRGAAAGPQWKRSDTANGGMEFDIMEFLSGWGPCRYDIAMHWDGYASDHKSTGSNIYGQPDKDGYITAGLLWTPGSAIYYCNGKEVLHFESDRISNVQSFIILDMVSGGWDNTPLEDDKLPADFSIDYVRVWQRKDLSSSVDGPVKDAGDPYAKAPAK